MLLEFIWLGELMGIKLGFKCIYQNYLLSENPLMTNIIYIYCGLFYFNVVKI